MVYVWPKELGILESKAKAFSLKLGFLEGNTGFLAVSGCGQSQLPALYEKL